MGTIGDCFTAKKQKRRFAMTHSMSLRRLGEAVSSLGMGGDCFDQKSTWSRNDIKAMIQGNNIKW
jgi:hypothetical protein